MKSMHRIGKKRKQRKTKGEIRILTREEYEGIGLDSRLALIQELIPIGMMAISEILEKEVFELAGGRYQRKTDRDEIYRHGYNPGTVKLLGQKVPIEVPRVRGKWGEKQLQSYEQMHNGTEINERLFHQVLYGISCRNYEKASEIIPGAIGISKSTVSREFVLASSKELKAFQERRLEQYDIVAIFIDGKTFADDEMVIALGVTIDGEKVFLGIVQTDTENSLVLTSFLNSLLERGLNISKGILTVIDGAKGIRSAIKTAFKKRAVIQRCQWHKRENVVGYLPKSEQKSMRKRLQDAYNRPTEKEARKALKHICKTLQLRNQSAASSLDEGFEETLTLHRLGVFAKIGASFKTTNCIESTNAQIEERCGKVDYWKNSRQKHRWLASALLDIEPRLRRIRGYQKLHLLREAIMRDLNIRPAVKKVA